MPKDRPIIFHARSIKGILSGRKTQTRRIMKPQPPEWCTEFGYTAFTPDASISGRGRYEGEPAEKFFKCRYGKRGDRLWVRETWQPLRTQTAEEQSRVAAILERFRSGQVKDIVGEAMAMSSVGRSGELTYLYAADFGDWAYHVDSDLRPWKPSIHMPRVASRFILDVVSIRVERVQDISEKDALAEGLIRNTVGWWLGQERPDADQHSPQFGYHAPAFAQLWDDTNGKGAWQRNDWVWVIEFKRCQ
jgi:hypothetical protein